MGVESEIPSYSSNVVPSPTKSQAGHLIQGRNINNAICSKDFSDDSDVTPRVKRRRQRRMVTSSSEENHEDIANSDRVQHGGPEPLLGEPIVQVPVATELMEIRTQRSDANHERTLLVGPDGYMSPSDSSSSSSSAGSGSPEPYSDPPDLKGIDSGDYPSYIDQSPQSPRSTKTSDSSTNDTRNESASSPASITATAEPSHQTTEAPPSSPPMDTRDLRASVSDDEGLGDCKPDAESDRDPDDIDPLVRIEDIESERISPSNMALPHDDDQDIPEYDEEEMDDPDEEEQIELINEIQEAIEEEYTRSVSPDEIIHQPSFYRGKKKKPSTKEMATLGLGDIAAR